MQNKCFILSFLIFCLAWFHVQADTSSPSSPDAFVKEVTEQAIAEIQSNNEQITANKDQLYQLVNDLIVPHFDFVNMSKWMLGKGWKSASAEQQDQFIAHFKVLLIRTYANALLKYSDQEIKYLPPEMKPNSKLALVRTEVVGKDAKSVAISYRMYRKGEQWKVIDVIVSGVSLVGTYKQSFTAQVENNGFDSLIADIKDKNAKIINDTVTN